LQKKIYQTTPFFSGNLMISPTLITGNLPSSLMSPCLTTTLCNTTPIPWYSRWCIFYGVYSKGSFREGIYLITLNTLPSSYLMILRGAMRYIITFYVRNSNWTLLTCCLLYSTVRLTLTFNFITPCHLPLSWYRETVRCK